MQNDSEEKYKATQVIASSKVEFEHPHPDVHVAKILIANASWVNTSEGTVVVDTLLTPLVSRVMKTKLDETGGPVKYVIYTHGHRDHVGGSSVFKDDQPEFIAQSLLTERLEKYEILKEHHHRIASIQFNLPFDPEMELPPVVQPTKTYDETMEFKLGGKTFELYHARAETDDAT